MKNAILVSFVLITILISGCSEQREESFIEGTTITISNFAFEPSAIAINAGTTVTWKHNDNIAHTVVSQGLFESEILNNEDTFTFTFPEAGEYTYQCGIHPSMTGKVKVI